MASSSHTLATTPDTLITVKVAIEGSNRRFKLPLSDLTAASFPEKVRTILAIPDNRELLLERYSDSGNAYIALDPAVPSAYKQLFRAAKAKLKLRIKATVINETYSPQSEASPEPITPTFGGVHLSEMKPVRSVYGIEAFKRCCEDISCKPATIFQESPSSWQVFCNDCDKPMDNTHYHCGICDNGDYDLCESCVAAGKTCSGEGHWLIKRYIENGEVINSTTERLAPKPRKVSEKEHEMPGAFLTEKKASIPQQPHRTCNACVTVLPENAFVTCINCPDYDLCVACFHQEIGHHPGHSFQAPAFGAAANAAFADGPGPKTRHHAICDGCDKHIIGTRHKCLECPDWDYCSKCHENAQADHPNHRFVPVYETLAIPAHAGSNHYGIYCDGPLCNQSSHQTCITGVRYKCAICHDMDFCANCEAHPSNKHNATHPLIKFKIPVRDVSITTLECDRNGIEVASLGDHRKVDAPVSTNSLPFRESTQSASVTYRPLYATIPNTGSAAKEGTFVPTPAFPATTDANPISISSELDAVFIHDTIADGTKMAPCVEFVQTWKLKNPGPSVWPRGCSVYYVGGDNMFNVDRDQPLSVTKLAAAQMSNTTETEVGKDGEVEFAVTMRAPGRDGRHISYWRLGAPNGTFFGHRLWCDINIKAPTEDVVEVKSGGAANSGEEQAREVKTEATAEPNLEDSLMVFPTLEKESPSSSTYQDTASATSIFTAPERVAQPAVVVDVGTETETETETVASGEDHFEDVKSVKFDDSDDGFMTDEEYDILDASDEEVQNYGRNGK